MAPKPVTPTSSKSPGSEKASAAEGVKLPATSNGTPANNANGGKSGHQVKLSGDATTFMPSGNRRAPISFLNQDSTPDIGNEKGPTIVTSPTTPFNGNFGGSINGKAKAKPVQQPVGTPGEGVSPTGPPVYFTTDVGPGVNAPGGHYIKIDSITAKDIGDGLGGLYETFGWNKKVLGTHYRPAGNESNFMKVFVCFDDTRDAAASFDQVGMVNSTWNAVYIHQAEYASAKKDGEADTDEKTSYHDGQVVLVCSFNGLSSDFTLSGLEDEVRMLAQSFGDLLAFREFESDGGKWRYRAEYHKISAAKEAMGSIKGHKIGKWIVNTEELPDYTTVVVSTPSKDNQEAVAEYMSPTGRTTWRSDEHGNQISAMPATLVPKCYGAPVGTMLTPQSTRHRSDPHGYPHTPASHFGSVGFTPRSASFPNHRQRRTFEATPSCQEDPMTPENVNNIDKSRILNGQDVRTTVMFRNIYNWYTVHDIKRLLNEHCPGVYNFVYLRIDYSTGTNMGYCFVNFTDPLCVAAFMDKFEGAEWPQDSAPNQRLVRRNPRAAGFSHASIQGLDCLIEKFRNSSVLDEAPDYRPKLIYSNEDAPMPSMVGMEYNFPPPNNPSKLGRSRDNATQVGLYEPGHRKGRFSGMFGRRSQFDRGTTSQMREDAFYNMMQPPLGYNPAYMHMPGPVPMVPPPAFGGMYQHPVNNGYVHGGPVMPAPEYASTPFREPFRNPFSNANIGSPTPRGGHWRSGGRRNNTWVHPGRDEETADREIAEQRANDMYEVNMGRAPPPAHLQHQYNCYQVPRIAEADEAEQHPAVVNYSAYTNNHVNGNGAYGGNGYAVNGNGANGYTANGDNGNGFGYNSYYQQY